MIFSDCNFFKNGRFCYGSFEVNEGMFTYVKIDHDEPEPGKPYVIPGLIDIHTHGCMDHDFSDGNPDAMAVMAEFYAKHGVTSFCPTSLTLPYDVLGKAFSAVKAYADSDTKYARAAGIHMEGPYFSVKKKGAQNEAYLKLPDIEGFKLLNKECGGIIKMVDVAPELEGAVEFAEEISQICTVSVAHTDADYEQAYAVFDAGADHLTHMYNGMPPIHHRNPGVIGAAADHKGVYAELICDGHHVHPSAVRIAFSIFHNRICLISDSLRCAGMPDGEYEIGGQAAFLKDGVARLENGTIAGSSANLFQCLKNVISFGIPVDQAIEAATINPAKSIGIGDIAGSIEPGKLGDFIVCDESLELEQVFIGGNAIE